MFDRLSAYAPQALAVLRIVTALLFIESGSMKLFGFRLRFPSRSRGCCSSPAFSNSSGGS